MDARVPYSAGSVLLLLGAFAIGWVLHQVVVESAIGPLSAPAVVVTLLGLAAVVAGRRLERAFDPSAFVAGGEAEEEPFDEDLSPVPSERLEGLDRDDPE